MKRRVLVVGGSSGIGNGIARAFLAEGADVHVWGTRPTAFDYAGEAGSDLAGLGYTGIDIGETSASARWPAPFDTLDVLVLAQGTVLYGRQEYAMPGFEQVLNVNLTSVMACALRFKDMLAATRGSLIAIGSIAALQAVRGNPAYCASKTAILGLTRTLGQAWAADGIRVNAIAPGFVDTKLTKVTTANPERSAATLATIPAGRFGTPADMAGVALFLASPAAAYVIGQTITVDGGLTL